MYSQGEILKMPDSLEEKSYKYLNDRFLENRNDTLMATLYLNTIVAKGIVNDDKIAKSHALVRLSSYAVNDKEKLDYIQQSIAESNSVDSLYSIPSYNSLGLYYQANYDYEKALEEYVRVLKLSITRGVENYEIIALDNIAEIKQEIGQYKEALDLYRKGFYLEQNKEDKNPILILGSSLSLSESFRHNKQYDSASYYYASVIDDVRQKYPTKLSKALINEGINLYHKNEYKEAKILLQEGMVHVNFNSHFDVKYYILANYYTGKMLQVSSDKKAEQYFLKVHALLLKHNATIPELKDVYTTLINAYKETGDQKKQLYFQDRLIYFNEVIAARNLKVSNKINTEFDTPKLLKKRDKLIKSLRTKNEYLNTVKIILSVLLVVMLIVLSVLYIKHKKQKKRFKQILKEIDNQEQPQKTKSTSASSQKLNIDPQLVEDILERLQVFESKKGFIKNTITIAILAKKLSTNTKYLSKIINAYKGKTFITYINDLRIEYVLKELQMNPKLQQYTLYGIAKEIGFNSADSFSTAFKKKTGISPSYYMKNLKNIKKEKVAL
ncbi:helix-turn-helix domain-containing protein [Dokdonia ponticola]|uniref:Helix-turn-helix domain-containing protein n=1 Tax=Dokdonia ponticola TaxID=2041041 RepID=A0ABV9HYJ0_9FLAO